MSLHFRRAFLPVALALLLPMRLAAQRTLIHAGTLIDGVSEAPRTNVTLVIEQGKISAVEPGFSAPRDRDVVYDFKRKFVLPGLIDMHTHLSGQTEKAGYLKRFQLYPADMALAATPYLKNTWLAGFTTVRDLGGSEGVDLALRNAVKRGEIIGPRMFAAGKSLAVLGGHADPTNSYREDILGVPGIEEGIVNGVESARRAALLAIKRGSDWIKITATAGVLSLSGNAQNPQFTEEEIRVIVQTAADFGKKVAAHAHGAEGAKRAIRAGVASIEHGTYLDDEAFTLMKNTAPTGCPRSPQENLLPTPPRFRAITTTWSCPKLWRSARKSRARSRAVTAPVWPWPSAPMPAFSATAKMPRNSNIWSKRACCRWRQSSPPRITQRSFWACSTSSARSNPERPPMSLPSKPTLCKISKRCSGLHSS